MKPRDGCEWWTSSRTLTFAKHLRDMRAMPGGYLVMHSSWCGCSRRQGAACTCVPVTLTFGATA